MTASTSTSPNRRNPPDDGRADGNSQEGASRQQRQRAAASASHRLQAYISRYFIHPHISLLAAAAGTFTLIESVYWASTSPVEMLGTMLLALRFAAIVSFVLRPKPGSCLVVVSQILDLLTSVSTPTTMLITSLIAVGVASFLDARLGGALGALLVAAALTGMIIHHDSAMHRGGILSFVAFVLIAFGAGLLTRLNTRHRAQELQNLALRRNALIAQRLHDYTTNDMNNIIMLADLTLDGDSDHDSAETIQLIRSNALNALTQTRQAILALRDDGEAQCPSHMAGKPSDLRTHLIQLVDEQQEMLDRLGFTGTVFVPSPFPETDTQHAPLIMGLVKELFGNIARHAAPDGGYVMTICASDEECDLSLSDTPAGIQRQPQGQGDAKGLGSGMRHYREQIEALHGQWHIEQTADSWTLETRIPWDSKTTPRAE